MSEKVVIIGAGQAAAQAVASLKTEGHGGPITVVGDELFAPYERPPLSKDYLSGKKERERLFLKPPVFYSEAHCELLLGVSVSSIDRTGKTVALSDGRGLPYDKLLFATGSRVRRIGVPGAELAGIHYLRNIADVDGLRPALTEGIRLAVIGGGYIGLEVAAVARKLGAEVTVFELLDRAMARQASEPISAFFEAEHRSAGVQIHFNTGIESFEGDGVLKGVRAGGQFYPADIALVGIGVVPNVEIAEAAGLACEDGILVDDFCTSPSDPSIFAAGDCTRHHGHDGRLIRLESVQNAIDQAKHAVLAMVGKPKPYREVPWFWSEQYDLRLQIAGLAQADDLQVLRGDPQSRKFAVFHLRDGAVAAVEFVNAAHEYMVGRRLIAAGARIAPERLADTSIPMKQMM